MLRFPAVLCALAVGIASGTMAQPRLEDGAVRLCQSPPLTADAVDRVRRLPDYPRLLDKMATHCPQVAMLFSVFVVGEVDHAPHPGVVRTPPDFLPLIGPHRLFACCDVASIPEGRGLSMIGP